MTISNELKRTVGFNSTFRSVCSDLLLVAFSRRRLKHTDWNIELKPTVLFWTTPTPLDIVITWYYHKPFHTLKTFVLIFVLFMQVARHTRPEGHFKVWSTINYFSRGRCYLLLGLKQGYPPWILISSTYRSLIWCYDFERLKDRCFCLDLYL